MELNKITPTQQIAWWDGASLKIFQAQDETIVEVDNSNTSYTTLVLSGDAFSRRFHPRPFDNKDKLKKILPTFLADSLFSDSKNSKSIATVALQKTPTFSSFSIKQNILDDFVHKTGSKASPVVETLPLPLGLAYYAPKNTSAIIVASLNDNVVSAFVGDTGEIKDFRTVSKEKWAKEVNLTICGWKTNENIKVYSIGCVYIPQGIKTESIKIPQNIPENLAVLNGIMQMSKTSSLGQVINTLDKTTLNNKVNFYKKLVKPLILAGLLTAFAMANVYLESYTLQKTADDVQQQKSAIFTEVLPNTPQIDAVAQISRRLSELSYANGEKIITGTPLTQQITELQKQLADSKINLKINEISVSDTGFSLRGILKNLSDVEKVKQALASATGNNVILHNAQMIPATGVDFYMEARK